MNRRNSVHIEPSVATSFHSLTEYQVNAIEHMFVQDVYSAIVPIGGRSSLHKEFSATLIGSKEESKKAESLLNEFTRYHRGDITRVICDAIQEIAQNMSWHGRAVYEIAEDADGKIQIFSFTAKRLLKLKKFYVQFIPRKEWADWKKKINVISASKVACFEMPAELGGQRGYKKTCLNLKRFDYFGPPFARSTFESGQYASNFDFQTYVRMTEIYFRKVTNKWGWLRRDYSQEHCTEFYTFHRLIRHRKAQATVRESIVRDLNMLLQRLGIDCTIQLSGLPSPEEISSTLDELISGETNFRVASDRVRP